MITLALSNNNVYVWNSEDWLTLRKNHRIVGELVGCLPQFPRQDIMPGLPLSLLPEEVTLLIDRKIACLVHYPNLKSIPSEAVQQEFKSYREKLSEDQVLNYIETRKQQVTNMIETIVAGKRHKLMGTKPSKRKKMEPQQPCPPEIEKQINKEKILEEELAKIKPADEGSTMAQIFTAHPWLGKGDEEEVVWKFPETDAEKLRYDVFTNLWDKGHYITTGHRFGADFLVYPGDPIKFHAHFLVICLDRRLEMPILDLVALGRLGTSVRKTVVLASQTKSKEKTVFQSLTWNGTARF